MSTRKNRDARHLEACAGWELTPEQKAFLHGLVYNAGSRYRRLSNLEEAFVETLLIQAAYKMSRSEPFLATNEQLQKLLEVCHDIKLSDEQLRQLKQRFITKGKNKASKNELLVMEQEGEPGTPSRYRLTGLAPAFPTLQLPEEE
jgi:hypothetical protein